jgi:hypothetical protein
VHLLVRFREACYDFLMRARVGIGLVLALAGVALATPPKKKKKKAVKVATTTKVEKTDPSRLEVPKDVEGMPAVRYGQLSRHDCEAELETRGIKYTRESTTPGVVAPVRLAGPLHGVVFDTDLSESARKTSPYEIADCRLVLALDDFAAILAAHDVVAVRHYSMYRPPPKDWPDGKPGTRHNGALALDAARFTTKDGTQLVVDKDFNGRIDAKTCGDDAAPDPATPAALELRKILCETVDRHLFNVVLTPNYNKEHHNHFHLEVTAGVKWFLVH